MNTAKPHATHLDGARGQAFGLDPTRANTTTWPWWWSADEERFHGPHATRQDAILAAFYQDDGDGPLTRVTVLQAIQGPPRCDLWEGDQLAERFDDINEDLADPDRDRALAEQIPQATWDAMAAQLTAAVQAAVARAGVTPYMFTSSTGPETIDLAGPRLAAAGLPYAPAILDLIDALKARAPIAIDATLTDIRRLATTAARSEGGQS